MVLCCGILSTSIAAIRSLKQELKTLFYENHPHINLHNASPFSNPFYKHFRLLTSPPARPPQQIQEIFTDRFLVIFCYFPVCPLLFFCTSFACCPCLLLVLHAENMLLSRGDHPLNKQYVYYYCCCYYFKNTTLK